MSKITSISATQHIFIIGSKSIGQYGGYETFVYKLLEQHCCEDSIKYHIACKANGIGYMDESKLENIEVIKSDGKSVKEFNYKYAHVFKIAVPDMGSAEAIYYDLKALDYSIRYCKEYGIVHPIFYVLACRIGPFIGWYAAKIKKMGGRLYLNPDGHEWKRAKWSAPVRRYWKISERLMVKHADIVVCDSVNIEKYIKKEYGKYSCHTTFIAYGADIEKSRLSDQDVIFRDWLKEKGVKEKNYYLIVGRFVPENNYETMIREYMKSDTPRSLVLITNVNEKFMNELKEKLKLEKDPRINFAGVVYDQELLKKIRENAYGYLHGHEVGGTNPSLLEALGSTDLNLLLNVGFNREVAQDAALYWDKTSGSLAGLINTADRMEEEERRQLGDKAKNRIRSSYNWKLIADRYKSLWFNDLLI